MLCASVTDQVKIRHSVDLHSFQPCVSFFELTNCFNFFLFICHYFLPGFDPCGHYFQSSNSHIGQGQPVRYCFHPGASSDTGDTFGVANAPEISSKDMLKAMMSYVWPKDDEMIRKRVVLSLSLLIASKVANVGVPFLFKAAVDGLNVLSMATAPEAVLASTVSLLIGYGIARSGAAAFNEIRNAVFAKVAHHSIRKIATNVFMHLHNLDLAFHLNRQTGALSKVR